MKRRAVFLDRDGTLIEERNYLSRPEDLQLVPCAGKALRLLREVGLRLVLVTNQSGIARGLFEESDLAAVHAHLIRELSALGLSLDGIYFCPHHPEGQVPAFARSCECRKPGTAMVEAAEIDLDLELGGSWMVGDKIEDLLLAHRAGMKGILVRSGHGIRSEAEGAGDAAVAVVDDLLAASRYIAKAEANQ